MHSNTFFAKLDRPDKAMALRFSSPFSRLRRSCKILLCLAALLLPDFSFGATSYYLCPLKTHGIDRETIETFRILLYSEISEAGGKVDLLQDFASPARDLKSPNAARIKGVYPALRPQDYSNARPLCRNRARKNLQSRLKRN